MRSRLTPAIVIIVSALVTASIIGGELVLLAKFDKQAATFGLPQLGTATMPDGSVLTLHAVSYGQAHTLPVPVFPQGVRWSVAPANLRTVSHRSHVDRVVFMVSCHDPETKEFLDVDWWSHCLLQDAHGEEIRNHLSVRSVHSMNAGTSESSSNRHPPFRPLQDHLASVEDKRVILTVEFPVFRPAGSSSLKFFNSQNEEVAAVPFVPSWNPSASEWAPQPLPATADRGAVSLVLNDVQLKAHERSGNDSREGPRWRLQCQAALQKDGQPARNWSWGLQNVADVLGNEVSPWDVTLSRKEPAWRVRFQATRNVRAEFTDDERGTISGIRVLDDNTFDTELNSLQIENSGLVPVVSAGVGEQQITIPYFMGNRGSRASSGSVSIETNDSKYARYRLEWGEFPGSPGQTLRLNTQAPCLILRSADIPAGTQLLVRTRDAEGREVRSHIRQFYDFAWLIFFDAKPDDGELTCELLRQTPLEFEFFIKPPETELTL
ncbi:MAG: hypothetical protein ACYTGL_18695 [Planctomycetota bacterium]|jgi:hypothetical protein